MCNRYVSPSQADMERYWHIGAQNNNPWRGGGVFPRAQGPFIRRARHDAAYTRELVVGQWGLIPWFAKQAKLTYSTNNARSEDVASKASYKDPWKRGQRCVIPAVSFDEPYWGPYESQYKKCEWWTFRRKDGEPWGLAGLWNVWVDKATGEEVESYTMLTINADGHPLMGKMHKNELDPETKKPLPLERQDKRSVIPIALDDVDQWLQGTADEAKALLQVPAESLFDAGPTGPA